MQATLAVMQKQEIRKHAKARESNWCRRADPAPSSEVVVHLIPNSPGAIDDDLYVLVPISYFLRVFDLLGFPT
jgi:hypothetical protein